MSNNGHIFRSNQILGSVFASHHFSSSGLCFRVRACRPVYNSDPMFLWISLNSCPVNLLLVRSHRAEKIIVKRFIQGCNNVTRVRVEPRSCNQSYPKNDAFTRCPRFRLFELVHKKACLKKYCVSFNLTIKLLLPLEGAELLPYPCILENLLAC